MSLQRPTTKRLSLLALLAVAISVPLAGCGSGAFGAGSGMRAAVAPQSGGPYTEGHQCANPGPGLAATDLSGQCRGKSQATLGALEAAGG
jgi:hypothetical protein